MLIRALMVSSQDTKTQRLSIRNVGKVSFRIKVGIKYTDKCYYTRSMATAVYTTFGLQYILLCSVNRTFG